MAFENGVLFTVGNYTVSGKNYINAESYKCTKIVQDLDSYRDADGVLHRNALSHITYKIEISTRPGLTESEMTEFLSSIQANFSVALERKASVRFFVPELDDYMTQDMYMSEPPLEISTIRNGKIIYKSCKFSFIGY